MAPSYSLVYLYAYISCIYIINIEFLASLTSKRNNCVKECVKCAKE